MKRFILLIIVLFAFPAFAIDTNRYPGVLIDQTCTDSYDAPAAPATSPLVSLASYLPAIVQTSGDPDNRCDNDAYIRKGAITSDTTFGPFKWDHKSEAALVLQFDVSASDANYEVEIGFIAPHDATYWMWMENTPDFGSGASNRCIQISNSIFGSSWCATKWSLLIPDVYYLKIDLITATSVTAGFSQILMH